VEKHLKMAYNHFPGLTRRQFVKMTAWGATGFALSQCGIEATPIVTEIILKSARGVFPFIAEFAKSVGFSVSGRFLYDYLKEEYSSSDSMVQGIEKINSIMANGGFVRLDNSIVYTCDPYICYAAGHENGIDACLTFFSESSKRWITMAEGPSIIGMALGAKELSSVDKAQRMFMPVGNISHSKGNLYSGYSEITHYKNQGGGQVVIGYDKLSDLEGRILIKSVDGVGYLEREYNIQLPQI